MTTHLESLICSALDEAGVTRPEDRGPAVRETLRRLDDPTRVLIIAELSSQLPAEEVPHLALGHCDKALELVRRFPDAWRAATMPYAQVRLGRCVVGAFGSREAIARPARRDIAWPPRQRNGEAGVIVPEFLAGLGLISLAACTFVLWVARGPLYAAALLGWVLCAVCLLRKPKAVPNPVQVPSVSPSVQARLCAADAAPVEVVRFRQPNPSRPKRGARTGPHHLPQRGSVRGDVLCVIIGGVWALAAACFSAAGCTLAGNPCSLEAPCAEGRICVAGRCMPERAVRP